jgi:hypothetical protein
VYESQAVEWLGASIQTIYMMFYCLNQIADSMVPQLCKLTGGFQGSHAIEQASFELNRPNLQTKIQTNSTP